MGNTSVYRKFKCPICGKEVEGKFSPKAKFCSAACKRILYREYHHEYNQKNKSRIKAKNKQLKEEKKKKNWCQVCGRGVEAVLGKTLCQRHLDLRKQRNRVWREQREREKKCMCCGRERLPGLRHCPKCASQASVRIRRIGEEQKRKIIAYLGGKCQDCGRVSDIPVVFDVHHLNPETKEWSLKKIRTYSWERIEKELAKGCVLLCAVCHRIRHYLNQDNKATWKDLKHV